MTTITQIPIQQSVPQQFGVYLNKVRYVFRLFYVDTDEGGWELSIGDSNGNPLACGIPLVTNCDLLEQYEYLGIGGQLYVATPGPDLLKPPTEDNLGQTSFLYFAS